MRDTILDKDTILVNIGDDHTFSCTVVTLGRTGENAVSQLEITIPDELSSFWAYLDFRKPSGKTVKTPRLDIIDHKIEYDIPQGLLNESGNLEAQLVLQGEAGEIWKSTIKKFVVLKSIDAGDDIPAPDDFITNAQKILDETVETTERFKTEFTDELNEVRGEVENCADAIRPTVRGEVITLSDVSQNESFLNIKATPAYNYDIDPYMYMGDTYLDGSDPTMGELLTAECLVVEDINRFVERMKEEGVTFESGQTYDFEIKVSMWDDTTEILGTRNEIFYNGEKIAEGGVEQDLADTIYDGVTFGERYGLYLNNVSEDTSVKIKISYDVKLWALGKNFYDNTTTEKDRDTTTTGYSKFKIELPNGVYTWSLPVNKFFGSGIYALITDDKDYNGTTPAEGCFISWVGHSGAESLNITHRNFTVTKGFVYLAAGMPSGSYMVTLFEYLKEFQIELGTTPTDYEPHRKPIAYPVCADGTVKGVIPFYPVITLCADKKGVMLEANYKADTLKFIENTLKKLANTTASIEEV